MGQPPLEFQLRDIEFTIDSSRWGATGSLSSITCSKDADCVGMESLCSGDCNAFCAQTSVCHVSAEFSLWQEVVAAAQNPELAIYEPEVINITSATVTAVSNTLNPMPDEMSLLVAPRTVVDSQGDQAVPFWTLPVAQLSSSTPLELLDNATNASSTVELQEFLADPNVPFNILAGGRFAVEPGQMFPTGSLTISVSLDAVARR